MAENKKIDAWFDQIILKNEKKILAGLIIILFIFILILGMQIKNQRSQDSHWHMALVKNLASGNGYTIDGEFPHGKYPPGLALLILPFYFILHNVQLSGMILVGILSLLSLILAYKVGKIISPLVGLITAILLMTHNLFLYSSVSIMTEVPFIFFSIGSIYFLIKSSEKKFYIIPSFLFLSISMLIRYDGFFLCFPFLFYIWKEKKQFRKLLFTKQAIIALILLIAPAGTWFLRNYLVFGNPLHSDYAITPFNFALTAMLGFLKVFFRTGFLFPFISLFGLFFIIKQKNTKINTFIVWFFAYMLLHMAWDFRLLRFYTEVLLLICFFASYGLIIFARNLTKHKKSFIIFLSISLSIIIISQFFIFFYGHPFDQAPFKVLNRYAPIQDLGKFASNLEDSADYVVPDIAVYSTYMEKPNMLYYNQWINKILGGIPLNNETYLFADNHHIWMTEPFLEGEHGMIQISLGKRDYKEFFLLIETELIKKETFNDEKYAILMKVKNVSIGTKDLI